MKAPIIINENGDICFFSTIQDATAYLEPVDVKNEEYEFYDAEGNTLKAIPTEPNITIVETDMQEQRKEHLTSILREFYKKIGLDNEWIVNATLEELVAHGITEYATK